MTSANEHQVGLRELRHKTGEVLARVRHGETVDITEYGRPIARIVPVQPRPQTSIMTQLIEAGRAKPATRPGYRPPMLSLELPENALTDDLLADREAERW